MSLEPLLRMVKACGTAWLSRSARSLSVLSVRTGAGRGRSGDPGGRGRQRALRLMRRPFSVFFGFRVSRPSHEDALRSSRAVAKCALARIAFYGGCEEDRRVAGAALVEQRRVYVDGVMLAGG